MRNDLTTEKAAMQIAIQGIRAKIISLEKEISDLQSKISESKKAEIYFQKRIREIDSGISATQNLAGRKRLPKGYPAKLIIDILSEHGKCHWSEIQKYAFSEFQIRMNRTTILNNLRELSTDGKITGYHKGDWEIPESGLSSGEIEELKNSIDRDST